MHGEFEIHIVEQSCQHRQMIWYNILIYMCGTLLGSVSFILSVLPILLIRSNYYVHVDSIGHIPQESRADKQKHVGCGRVKYAPR